MILQLDPQTPALVRGAATALLMLHIGGASAGLISGAVALIARKGGRLHRWSGTAFFVSMLIMAAIGAGVSPFLPQRGNIVPGILTFYLVATAWLTVRRPPRQTGRLEIAGFLLASAALAIGVDYGIQAMNAPTGELDGEPPSSYFVFASLTAFAAILDLRMLRRGGLVGVARIARHVWRMCLALLIATTSFFLGQQQVLPEALHGSPILFAPELAVLVLMLFWLIRIRFPDRTRAAGAVMGSAA